MYQGGSDAFLGPCDDILLESEDWGIDVEGEIAVITGDVPMGIPTKKAGEHIPPADAGQRRVAAQTSRAEIAKGFGFFQSKPSSAFSPVALTPDELGAAWDGGKLSLPLQVEVNGEVLGRPTPAWT